MSAELLAMLGGMPVANTSRREEEGKTILTFKAGRMNPVLQPNGKYLITADPRRGQASLLFTLPSSSSSAALKFEWKDRRTRSVVESFTIIPEDSCTFAPIPTGRDGERVYLLRFGSNTDRRFFFWMQDKFEPGVDDKHCIDMNKYLASVNECIVAAGGETPPPETSNAAETPNISDDSAETRTSSVTGGSTTNWYSASSTQQQQVDALSNILENLGMPQPSVSSSNSNEINSNANDPHPTSNISSSTSVPSTTTTPSNASGGVLTLADLQGAMAGLATNSPINTTPQTPNNMQHPTPPLTELVTSEAISESRILENPEAVARLLDFLPEDQRTEEMLRENLRSPQVQQALHNLTLALAGDESGGASIDSYRSIIANFQLNAEDGAAAMASGNPIQAFLDCLTASVTRDSERKEKEESKGDE